MSELGKARSAFDIYFGEQVQLEPEEVETKICTRCQQDLPMDSFIMCRHSKNGRYYPAPRCKACRLEVKREWRAKNKDNKGVVK